MHFIKKEKMMTRGSEGAAIHRPLHRLELPNREKTFAGIVLALLFLFRPVFSSQEEGLTLGEAIAAAMAGNPEILSAKAEVEATKGRMLQFSARPESQLTAAVEGVTLPGLKNSGEKEVSLNFEQPFEFPGKRSLRTKIGQCDVSLAECELERTKLIVAAKVKRSYWKVAFAKSAAKALEKSSARLDLLLADLQAKYRSGAAAYADILRTRAEKARLRNQILEQENERHGAGLELNGLLARQADEPVVLLTAMPFSPLVSDLKGMQEIARSSRPSQKIAALRRDRAAAALKLAKLEGNPDFLASFSLPSVRPEAWGISFGLTLPFLQPGRSRGRAMEAVAEVEIARLAADAQDRRIRSAVASAYSAVTTTEEQVKVFEQSLLRELEDELHIQVEYYRYGKVDFYNLLDLHRTFVLAELDHLRAVLLFNLALADLEVAGEELP
jgi:outer membrane protein, heavy metal efflux system